MKAIGTVGMIVSLIEFLITIVFFIPSIFVYIAYHCILPPIITFVILHNFAKKKSKTTAIIYNIIIHILLFFTFISINNNPGTDDSLAGLGKVVNSGVSASLFTFAAFIFFIIYMFSVFKPSKDKKNISELSQETKITQPQQTEEKLCDASQGCYDRINK